MITSFNIVEFFEQYKRNLEREEALNEAVLDAEDQEVWMENLRAKSRGLRQIYVENEALLNLYLRPFLEQESRLTKELAAEFLKGLVDLGEQGVCDRLVCIRITRTRRRVLMWNGNSWRIMPRLRTGMSAGGCYLLSIIMP